MLAHRLGRKNSEGGDLGLPGGGMWTLSWGRSGPWKPVRNITVVVLRERGCWESGCWPRREGQDLQAGRAPRDP